MNRRWNCTSCGQRLWAPEADVEQAISCPSCSTRLTAPGHDRRRRETGDSAAVPANAGDLLKWTGFLALLALALSLVSYWRG
jgi:DNA-directed RNA polymerase subunit RPC12/RpoP